MADLREDIELSLKTFETDCLDMYWIHKDDESLPVENIVDNINTIIKEGKAKVVGCSNWHIERIQAANAYAKEHNVSISAPVLAYIINNKLPGVAIIGAETPEMLKLSILGAEVEMSPELADKLYGVE